MNRAAQRDSAALAQQTAIWQKSKEAFQEQLEIIRRQQSNFLDRAGANGEPMVIDLRQIPSADGTLAQVASTLENSLRTMQLATAGVSKGQINGQYAEYVKPSADVVKAFSDYYGALKQLKDLSAQEGMSFRSSHIETLLKACKAADDYAKGTFSKGQKAGQVRGDNLRSIMHAANGDEVGKAFGFLAEDIISNLLNSEDCQRYFLDLALKKQKGAIMKAQVIHNGALTATIRGSYERENFKDPKLSYKKSAGSPLADATFSIELHPSDDGLQGGISLDVKNKKTFNVSSKRYNLSNNSSIRLLQTTFGRIAGPLWEQGLHARYSYRYAALTGGQDVRYGLMARQPQLLKDALYSSGVDFTDIVVANMQLMSMSTFLTKGEVVIHGSQKHALQNEWKFLPRSKIVQLVNDLDKGSIYIYLNLKAQHGLF